MIRLNITNDKIHKYILIDKNEFDYKSIKLKISEIFKIDTDFFIIANNSFYFNDNYIKKIKLNNNVSELNLLVRHRLKGGIDAVISLLESLVNMFIGVGKLILQFVKVFEYIWNDSVVFDPPRLVNDILFAVTTGISTALDKLTNSISTSPDDGDKEESGPMGLNKREKEKICLPPTLTQVLLLIICPPLAIFFKYDFFTAIIPVIICGVLCVKLYYFPGLLFASLITLC